MSETAVEFGHIRWDTIESRPNRSIAGVSRWLHGRRSDGRFVGSVWGELRIRWHPLCNRIFGIDPVEVSFREGCDSNFRRTWLDIDGRAVSDTWKRRCDWCFNQLYSNHDVLTYAIWDEKCDRSNVKDMGFSEFKAWYHTRKSEQ